MVPLPTSDALLLREHAFYDTGNLKYVIPFMNLQNYNSSDGEHDFKLADFTTSLVFIGLMVFLIVNSRTVLSGSKILVDVVFNKNQPSTDIDETSRKKYDDSIQHHV